MEKKAHNLTEEQRQYLLKLSEKETYVMVPIEPTEEMKQAGNRALSPYIAPAMNSDSAYRAMIAAAHTLPSPTVSDKETYNAALDDAANACAKHISPTPATMALEAEAAYASCSNAILALKHQPAPPSDAEMLDWLLDRRAMVVEHKGKYWVQVPDIHGYYGALDFESEYDTRREAIKAAMQAEGENK